MIKIISVIVLCMCVIGCDDKDAQQQKSQEFVSVYIKKYPRHANIISRYDNCVGGKQESMEKCIFASTKNDIEIYIINDYIAARHEYLKGESHETRRDKKPIDSGRP